MKKFLLILTLTAGFILSSSAQISTSALKNVATKATAVASTSGLDVSSLSKGIMSKLTTSLVLTKLQNPKVLELVTSFLTKKSGILGLATSDKLKYATKLAGLTSTLNSGLKETLSADQFSKFLKLKPAANSADNVLSQLFY